MTTTGVDQTEIMSMCAAKWKSMNDEQKLPFKNQAENDKERYKREMEEYKKVHARITRILESVFRPTQKLKLSASRSRPSCQSSRSRAKSPSASSPNLQVLRLPAAHQKERRLSASGRIWTRFVRKRAYCSRKVRTA